MHKSSSKKGTRSGGWLLFFYTVPSKPVSNRMKVWRKLIKAGAIPLKGAVYLLPANDDHYELCQWLVNEIAAMQGEAAFAKIERIETMDEATIVALFNQQRANDYETVKKGLEEFEQRVNNVAIGGQGLNHQELSEQLNRLRKEFQETRGIDFFSSTTGNLLEGELTRLAGDLDRLHHRSSGNDARAATVASKASADYQGRLWVTRKKPFVDRMASAWLIKRFIDPEASFAFIDDQAGEQAAAEAILFDLPGGEFTHVGELCTFEVLLKAFGLKNKPLQKMAAIIHDLDIKDEKYGAGEGQGLEAILSGIRKTASDDRESLEEGMRVFELLHASKHS